MMISKPKAVGVHIFAGGFTLGLKKAGFEIVAHLEAGKYGVESAKLNWPTLPIFVGEENWPLTDNAIISNIDLVYANPPCAIFSSAGIATTRGSEGWKTDPRLNCWYQAFSVFKKIKPKVFALESVTQAYTKGRSVVDDFTGQAIGLGYSAIHLLEDAVYTGIPQHRKRFFLIFHKPWLPLEFRFNFSKPLTTVGEVLDRIKNIGYVDNDHLKKASHKKCIEILPQGEKLRMVFDDINLGKEELTDKGRVKDRPGFLYYRLKANAQMGVFIGDVGVHPTENRFLGTNEMKALCGYPVDFKLEKNPKQHPSFLARAVLPPIGEWLGRSIRKVLSQKPNPNCKQTVLLTDIRKPPGIYTDLTHEYIDHQDETLTKFTHLVCRIKACCLCPRMDGITKIMSQANGSLTSKILFVGEAPGKDENGLTGLPFYGDASGINFRILLASIGLSHKDVFITNAIVCSPIGPDGHNDKPTEEEIHNCSSHLRRVISIINPKVVVSLGSVALSALALIDHHNLQLSKDIGKPVKWLNRILIPMYHPSPRVFKIRSMSQQRNDFQQIKKVMEAQK